MIAQKAEKLPCLSTDQCVYPAIVSVMAMTWSSWLLPNVLLYYIGLVILINYGKATDVCKNHNYTVISDARRSTKNAYNATRGDKLLCDRTKIKESVWYRFELVDGNQLPTTRPEPSYCGTTVPIWMNGSHPSVADGIVERQACAHVSGRFPFGCGYSYIIKVLNCNGFYIYQLKPPKNCHIAYCVGTCYPVKRFSYVRVRTEKSKSIFVLVEVIRTCAKYRKIHTFNFLMRTGAYEKWATGKQA